ncbi:chaperone NapD [Neorhodopirellula lusitana]|uniref:chaperone NapD n=1 Tax=Neorhodopirellula lusitana TaxID=445327 RepID=UPI00384A61FA
MPISGLVVTFGSSTEQHSAAIEKLRDIPEVEIGDSGGSKLAIVVDSKHKRRDQEIWNAIQDLPGVIDLAVAMVAFDEEAHSVNPDPTDVDPESDANTESEGGGVVAGKSP